MGFSRYNVSRHSKKFENVDFFLTFNDCEASVDIVKTRKNPTKIGA